MEMRPKGKGREGQGARVAAVDEGYEGARRPGLVHGSCEKIKYMFPKGHAVAYVMMAYRVGWYKVYRPLAYYAAYFSIRAKAFSYEKMCQRPAHLEEIMDRVQLRARIRCPKMEQDQYGDMCLVEEMYARGFEFMPIDIYRVQPHRFQIIDGKTDAVAGCHRRAWRLLRRTASCWRQATESSYQRMICGRPRKGRQEHHGYAGPPGNHAIRSAGDKPDLAVRLRGNVR
jgi:hypothetical protein